MDEPSAFISLASLLFETQPAAVQNAPAEAAVHEPEESAELREAWQALAREVRLFRARLEDELAIALDALLPDLAADVLGRELRLQPVDLANIVSAAVARYAHEEPLRVRVHPSDAGSMAGLAVEVLCDGEIRRGDAILELRCGTIDATLGARLDELLQTARDR